MHTLPKTKFYPPIPNRELITRQDLTGWLQKELPASRLVLLSAPAGYGKTTLLSMLPQVLPDYHLAWLMLDSEDNDLIRFLSGLAEALLSVEPQLSRVIEEQLSASAGLVSGSAAAFPLYQTITLLINTLFSLPERPLILVLDDLHEITNPVIYDALDYLLDHQPTQFHLAVSTRKEPPLRLNRLRARRQLAELNMMDLCFDLEESQRFINGVLNLGLSEADVNDLQRKTEGWPVGLVLLTNRLRHLPPLHDRAAFLQNLERIDPHTFHYLADEVLMQQPESLRNFLLESSILSELTPALCQAVTGRPDAEDLLSELYRRNLFLTLVRPAAGGEEVVYRYHALFAEFLRYELEEHQPERCLQLHKMAARAEKAPGRVIAHLLAAREWEAAAQKIEQAGEQFLEQGLQATVSGWISLLPAEVAGQRYRLMYIQGLSGLLEGNMEKAGSSLEASLGLLQIMEDPVTHGQVLVGLASLAFIHADFARCSELLHQAEPFHKGIRERIDFLMLRASVALFCESDLLQAGQDLNEAVELVQASDDPRLWFRFSLYLAPEFTVMPGTMSLLEQFCEQAQHWYRHQVAPLRLGVEDTWANIHLRRGRLQTAIEMGKDALWVKEQLGGYTFLGMNASLAVMNAYAALGNYPAAGDYLERTLQQVREAELNQALTGDGLYLLGKIRWLEGRYDEARQVLRQMAALQVRLPLVETLQKMLAGLLEISAQRYSQAETCLVEAVRLQSREYVSEFYGSARLQLAYLYFRWDKTHEALDQLEAVMARCEQRATPGVILQEMPIAAPLLRLAVKKGVRARQAAALLDQMGLGLEEEVCEEALLTERQMEILRLIEAGYSNQAIADQLTLSLATVKSHVVHIMNRLGVSSRMEAVACARKMGLLK